MKWPGNDPIGARSFLNRLKDRLGLKNLAPEDPFLHNWSLHDGEEEGGERGRAVDLPHDGGEVGRQLVHHADRHDVAYLVLEVHSV